MGEKPPGKPFSLAESDISSQRSLTRRSILGLGLTLGASAAAVVAGPARVAAQRPVCSDSDRGPNQDPSGMGRRCRAPISGCTDNDRGPNEDPPSGGRWCWI
jgi:hypothetical protein